MRDVTPPGARVEVYKAADGFRSAAVKAIVDTVVVNAIYVRVCTNEGNMTEVDLTACVEAKLARVP